MKYSFTASAYLKQLFIPNLFKKRKCQFWANKKGILWEENYFCVLFKHTLHVKRYLLGNNDFKIWQAGFQIQNKSIKQTFGLKSHLAQVFQKTATP